MTLELEPLFVAREAQAFLDATTYGVRAGIDCTTQLQAAIDAAKAQQKLLVLPPGTLQVSASLDCRPTSGDNWPGMVGQGQSKTVISMTASNTPIVRWQGRYSKLESLTLTYATRQSASQTNSNCLQFEDWVFFCSFRNLLLSNGRQGIGQVDVNLLATCFSNSFDNVRFLDNSYQGFYIGGAGGSTGNDFRNIYISAPSLASTSRGFSIQGGPEQNFNQVNIEQANLRDCAIYFSGMDSATIASLHMEGLRLLGKGTSNGESLVGSFIRYNGRGVLLVDTWHMDSNFVGPTKVLSVVRSGANVTITIDPLDAQCGAAGDGVRVGDTIVLAGASDSAYNVSLTVTAVSGNTITASGVSGSPASPATVASGVDYMTCGLGSSPTSMSLVGCESNVGTVRVRGLRVRDQVVTGTTSAARSGLVRMGAVNASSSARIFFDDVAICGQANDYQWLENMPIVAKERTGNVATYYTRLPHRLKPFDTVVMGGFTDTSFNDKKGVTPVGEFAFSIGNTGSDSPLSVEASGAASTITAEIASANRTSGIVRITTAAAHGLKVGHRVSVRAVLPTSAMGDSETVVLSVPSATTFTYANAGTDVLEAAHTGQVMLLEGLSPTLIADPSTAPCVKSAEWRSKGCACLNFGSIASGATATATVSFYNTHTSDRIVINRQDTLPLILTARVTATGTITFAATNPTAGSVSASALLLTFEVEK